VEGGAPRGVPRLQPERQGPDGGLGLLGPPDPRRAGVDAAVLGTGAGLPAGGVHHRHRARDRPGGRRRLRRDRRPGRVPGGAAGAGRPARGGWVRRRPLAAPLRQGRGRAGPGPTLQAADAGPSRPRGVRPPTGPGQDGRADRPPPHHHAPDRGRPATEAEAREGLERWKARHGDVWPLLGPTDVLVDSMRGRSTTWYRIRLNLRNVPEDRRPPQEALEVDYDPWAGFTDRGR
jgi:hypothetical protein